MARKASSSTSFFAVVAGSALLIALMLVLLLLTTTATTPAEAAGAGTKTKSRWNTRSATVTNDGTLSVSVTDDNSASVSESDDNSATIGTRSLSSDHSASVSPTDDDSATYSKTVISLSRTGSKSLSISESLSDDESATAGTPSKSGTKSASESFTSDQSASESPTGDRSASGSFTADKSVSESPTDDESATLTGTKSRTPIPTPSKTKRTLSLSDTDDESASESFTADRSASGSPTDDDSLSFTMSLPNTSSETWSKSPTFSDSESATDEESASASPTADRSASVSQSESPSRTDTVTADRSASVSPTGDRSASVSSTDDDTVSLSPSDTRTLPPTPTMTFTLTSVTKSASESGRSPTEDRTRSVSPTDDDSISPSLTVTETRDRRFLSPSPNISSSRSKNTETQSVTDQDSMSFSLTRTSETVSRSPTPDISASVSLSKSGPSDTHSFSADRSQSLDTDTFSRALTKSNYTPSESMSDDDTKTLDSPTLSETGSESGSVSLPITDTDSHSYTPSLTASLSLSFSFSHSATFTDSVTPDDSASPSYSVSESRSRPSLSVSDSIPLTTSQLPPTTTPVPTPTRTLMTVCPEFCGKGVCSNSYPFYCVCFATERLGFWSKIKTLEGTCDRCRPGFFGLDCNRQCPGGTCATCGGHGICDEGILGSGLCTCYNNTRQGFWTGTSCGACIPGMYSETCARPCKCVRGLCDQGRYGTGRCDCKGTGFMGEFCEVCDPVQNTNCVATLACPNDCSGHGACVSVNSVTKCECNQYWGSSDCSQRCPSHPVTDLICYGRGICLDGATRSGFCQCNNSLGNFVPLNCSTCVQGYWGPTCSNICPTGSTTPCSGHGKCNANDGTCACDPGFGGSICSVNCPTSVPGTVCSGHGACGAVTATCVCHADTTRGFWQGTSCNSCTSTYSGAQCNIPCPVWPRDGTGTVCSSHGVCHRYNSSCTCTGNYCGVLCEAQYSPLNGTCMSCPEPNLFGVNCSATCKCVNGTCSAGRAGDGSCRCQRGYAGRYCNQTCEGGALNPCSGHGECDPATTQCVCAPGYAGRNCSLACPIADCSGHGTCSDGINGTGQCTCNAGWVFNYTGCNLPCPCQNGGVCNSTLQCQCRPAFRGDHCERCVDGRAGPNCDQVCGGVTNGTDCICNEGFGGPKCDIPCPVFDGVPCGGPVRGRCQSLTAKCACEPNYYGPDCACSDAGCKQQNKWTLCERKTGQCICDSSRDPSDPSCETCARGKWSDRCDQDCSCSGNGACDKLTGAQCSCNRNDGDGHWSGSACDSCAPGFMGSRCKQKSIAVTTLSPAFSNYPVPLQNQWSALDQKRDMYFLGGEKSVVFAFNMSIGLPTVKYVTGNGAKCSTPDGGDISRIWQNPWEPDKFVYLIQANNTCTNDVRVQAMPKNETFYAMPRQTMLTGLSTEYIRYAELVSTEGFICYVPERQTTTDSFQLGCRDLGDKTSTTFPLPVAPFDPVTSILWIPKRKMLLVTGAIGATCGFSFTDIRKVGLSDWDGQLQQQFTAQTPRVNCRSIDAAIFVPEYNIVLFGAMAIEGVLLSGVDFDRKRVMQGEVVHPSQQLRCSSLMLHTKTNVGLAAFANMLIKFRVQLVGGANWTVTAYGQQLMGNSFTLIRTFDMLEEQRIVLAPRRSFAGVQILRFLLIEVTAVFPPIAEARGGTVVVVTGNGFNPKAPTPVCRFALTVVPATIINETHATCVVPVSNSAEVCATNAVEVSLNNFSFTANKVLIERPSEPIVVSADPPRTRIEAPADNVTVTGRGFKDSPVLRCKFFFSPQLLNSSDFVIVRGIFVDPTRVVCLLGRAAATTVTSSESSGIFISLDGQLYSTTFAPFSVIGPVVGVSCAPSTLTNGSLPVTEFSARIIVQTYDVRGNLLAALDDVNRTATVNATPDVYALIRHSSGTVSGDPYRHLVFPMRRGVATVAGMIMDLPPVAVLSAQIFVDRRWSCPFSFVVTAGQLRNLRIKVQPLSPGDLLLPTALLPQTTEVELVDDGGNVVTGLENIAINVTLLQMNITDPLRPRVRNVTKDLGIIIARDTGVASFPPQILPIVFGSQYLVRFQVTGAAGANARIGADTVIFTPGCPRNMFQVFGESQCRDCPHVEATCNGSNVLVARAGFWRMDPDSLTFYRCPIERACLNASEFTGCASGYRGILCNDCEDTYGKDFSGKCQSCGGLGGDIATLALSVISVFIIFSLATLLYVQNCLHDETASAKVGTTLAITMTMLQTLSLLSFVSIAWPNVIFQLLSALETFLDFRIFNFLSADCIFRRLGIDTSAIFLFYGAVIGLTFGIPWGVRLIVTRFPNAFMTPDAVQAREEYLESPAYRMQFAAVEVFKRADDRKKLQKHLKQRKEELEVEIERRRAQAVAEGRTGTHTKRVINEDGDEVLITEDHTAEEEAAAAEEKRMRDALQEEIDEANRRLDESTRESMKYLKQHQPKSILLNALQVVFFFGIQPALRSAFEVLPCTTVVNSAGFESEVMLNDVRVECHSGSYIAFKVTAIIFVVTYAVVTPFLYGLGAAYYRFRYFDTFYKTYLGFSACGMKDDLWYWMPTILLRKIWLVIIVSFLQPPINLYFFVWSMMAFAWFAYSRHPFKSKQHIFLENLCNINIILTGNIAMTIHVVNDPESLAANALQGIALIFNGGALLILFVDMLRKLLQKTILARRRAKDMRDLQAGAVGYSEAALEDEYRLHDELEAALELEMGGLDVVAGSASASREGSRGAARGGKAEPVLIEGEKRVTFEPKAKSRGGKGKGGGGGSGDGGSASGAFPSAAAAAAAAANEEELLDVDEEGIDHSGRDIIAEFSGSGARRAAAVAASEHLSESSVGSKATNRLGFKAYYEPKRPREREPGALGALDDYFGVNEFEQEADPSTVVRAVPSGAFDPVTALLGGSPGGLHTALSTSAMSPSVSGIAAARSINTSGAGPDEDLINDEELMAALQDSTTSLNAERAKMRSLLEKRSGGAPNNTTTGGNAFAGAAATAAASGSKKGAAAAAAPGGKGGKQQRAKDEEAEAREDPEAEARRQEEIAAELERARKENERVRAGKQQNLAGIAANAANNWLKVERDATFEQGANVGGGSGVSNASFAGAPAAAGSSGQQQQPMSVLEQIQERLAPLQRQPSSAFGSASPSGRQQQDLTINNVNANAFDW